MASAYISAVSQWKHQEKWSQSAMNTKRRVQRVHIYLGEKESEKKNSFFKSIQIKTLD